MWGFPGTDPVGTDDDKNVLGEGLRPRSDLQVHRKGQVYKDTVKGQAYK
jgi:hypothetical protein